MASVTDVLELPGDSSDRFATAPFAVLPVGSIEFHGAHAPYGTDSTLATGFTRRLAAERDCLVFPTVHYSFVPRLTLDHGPGVSVAPQVFLAYLTEVIGGIVGLGVERLLIINGHSENQYALRLAAESVAAAHPRASLLVCNWWRLAPAGLFSENDGHGHGGPLEISTTAAFASSGVTLPAGAGADTSADVPYEAPWWRNAAQVVGRGQSPLGFAGYHGRVSEIDLDRGERVVTEVTAALNRLIDGWLARAGADSPTD